MPFRGPHQSGTGSYLPVETGAVPCDDVPHVCLILEPPLYFERGNTGIQQVAEPPRKVHIPYRKQVFAGHQHVTGGIQQVVGQPAGLHTVAPVSGARRHGTAHVTPPAVTHAYRPVHETLQLHIRGSPYPPDFLQGKVTFENNARKTAVGQESRLLRGGIESLRRGVQLHSFEFHLQIGHILHDERIRTRFDHLPCDTLGIGEFVIEQKGVERHINTHAEPAGILRHGGYVRPAVAGRLPRAETRSAHVNGIRTAVDSGTGTPQIAGRCKQLNLPGFPQHLHFTTLHRCAKIRNKPGIP